jgi:hypothetical protein
VARDVHHETHGMWVFVRFKKGALRCFLDQFAMQMFFSSIQTLYFTPPSI